MNDVNKTQRQVLDEMAMKIHNMDERQKNMDARANEMYNKLFVQNGSNNGQDCLSVQIQKNTHFRRQLQENQNDDRRSKWRRYGFYLSLAGLLISNILIVIKLIHG